jgi:hypothetical protein
MAADYGLIRGVTEAEANVTVREARQFVDACRIRWAFQDKATDD